MRYRDPEIQPDEIFTDSLNMPGFNEEQFEGRLERPISKYVVIALGIFFLLVGSVFTWRAWALQIENGERYAGLSERNHLRTIPIIAERGIIYDRNGTELAWNTEHESRKFSSRSYADMAGLGHVVGYVSMPKLDQSGRFWQTESIGKDGVEKSYDSELKGENGVKVIETDVMGDIISENTLTRPLQGKNVTLSIDAELTQKLHLSIADLADRVGYRGGAGVIMDVQSGEILALTSYPEYRSDVLVKGSDNKAIQSYLTDKRTPFLNRVVSGLYAPGSTVKVFVAFGALVEGIIDPAKQILSTGSISIPNPYDPSKPSIFKDWKAHGWVDMRDAIAVSSDVYFYAVGGGFQDQRGLGIANIEKYARIFGLGDATNIDLPGEASGTIPNPEWKAANFDGERWLIGDTYHTAIGQYGFQVTPLELNRSIAGLASGALVEPHVVLGKSVAPPKPIQFDERAFDTVREGMRQAVTGGTAAGLSTPGVAIAGKTGTAELGFSKDYVNSWVVGFFPYDRPKYAFTVVMERGPRANTVGGVYVMRQVFDWMQVYAPEYLRSEN